MGQAYKQIFGNIFMISVIITAFKEPKTIGLAIETLASQKTPSKEILVVAPDKETLDEAGKLRKKYKNIRLIKDSGNGKSAALNLAVSKSKGDILVLTDGDVHVSSDSINQLLDKLHDKVGAVSGRPISTNSKNNKYGFWSYLLTEIAHERREKAITFNRNFFCSGYLFAIRKNLFPKLPEELLSEDGYISQVVYKSGFSIYYADKAEVYVKYPDNFSDWIKQKKRSAGGYTQIQKLTGIEMRSFKTESLGAAGFLKYVKGINDLIWLIELFFARVYLWLVIYRDLNLKNKSRKELWERVESTK